MAASSSSTPLSPSRVTSWLCRMLVLSLLPASRNRLPAGARRRQSAGAAQWAESFRPSPPGSRKRVSAGFWQSTSMTLPSSLAMRGNAVLSRASTRLRPSSMPASSAWVSIRA
ncbi:hypothetical protein D3C76_1395550 [compost metagenome]